MIILAIDPGTKCGFAVGNSAKVPVSWSVHLSSTHSPEDLAATFGSMILGLTRKHRPELVAIERFISPVAQPSGAPVITSLMLHGAVAAICGILKVPLVSISPATWRKHFLGSVPKGRKEVKTAAVKRAQLLRYVPPDCADQDRAEACGIWDYSAAHYGRNRLFAL